MLDITRRLAIVIHSHFGLRSVGYDHPGYGVGDSQRGNVCCAFLEDLDVGQLAPRRIECVPEGVCGAKGDAGDGEVEQGDDGKIAVRISGQKRHGQDRFGIVDHIEMILELIHKTKHKE